MRRGPSDKIYGQLIYFKELVHLAQSPNIWAVSEHHGSWAAMQFSEKFKLFLGYLSPLACRDAIRNISLKGRQTQVRECFCSLVEI